MKEDNFKDLGLLFKINPATSSIKKVFSNIDRSLLTSERFLKALEINTSQIFSTSKLMEQLSQQVLRNKDFFYGSDISKVLSSFNMVPSSLNTLMQTNFLKLSAIQKSITDVYGLCSFKSPYLPTQKFLDSMSVLKSLVDVYKPPTEVVLAAFRVPNAYQVFAQKQFSRAIKCEEISDRVIEITDYAFEIVDNNEIVTEKCLEQINDEQITLEDEGIVPRANHSNIFSALNQHLSHLYIPDTRVNILSAIDQSMPAKINRLGVRLIELVYEINLFVQGVNGEPLFAPTVKSVLGAMILTNTIVMNESDFGDVIDHLFFMIYEGSGTAKRLLKLTDKENLSPLWLLKHLRLGLRHDLEHGEQKDIKKKFIQCGEAFAFLIGKPRPIKIAEWKLAQVKLYEILVEMLTSILKTIPVN